MVKSSAAATSFTAEAGKTYYFRTKTPVGRNSYGGIKLVSVDPAEAQVLITANAFSTLNSAFACGLLRWQDVTFERGRRPMDKKDWRV